MKSLTPKTSATHVNLDCNEAFGIGKKTDLDVGKNPHQVTPPPNSYSIPTFADVNKKHGKGFTPRFSREVKV